MADNTQKPLIKILKNGPYVVSGNIPLSEKVITPKGKAYEYREGHTLTQGKTYTLCRCGKSKNPPFCDGVHVEVGFTGTETASRTNYAERAEMIKGQELDLMDDHRCALARFCHGEHGMTWDLIEKSDNPDYKEEAIKTANQCPAGRLTAVEKSGKLIEPEYEPAIEILQDVEKKVSGPIAVKGNIPLQGADGHMYELRNRYTLCRCGESKDMPFCDCTHVHIKFRDRKLPLANYLDELIR